VCPSVDVIKLVDHAKLFGVVIQDDFILPVSSLDTNGHQAGRARSIRLCTIS